MAMVFRAGRVSIEVDVELSDGDWTCEFPHGGDESFGETKPDKARASFSKIVGNSNPTPQIELWRDTSRFNNL